MMIHTTERLLIIRPEICLLKNRIFADSPSFRQQTLHGSKRDHWSKLATRNQIWRTRISIFNFLAPAGNSFFKTWVLLMGAGPWSQRNRKSIQSWCLWTGYWSIPRIPIWKNIRNMLLLFSFHPILRLIFLSANAILKEVLIANYASSMKARYAAAIRLMLEYLRLGSKLSIHHFWIIAHFWILIPSTKTRTR